jgi:hypothetical protein
MVVSKGWNEREEEASQNQAFQDKYGKLLSISGDLNDLINDFRELHKECELFEQCASLMTDKNHQEWSNELGKFISYSDEETRMNRESILDLIHKNREEMYEISKQIVKLIKQRVYRQHSKAFLRMGHDAFHDMLVRDISESASLFSDITREYKLTKLQRHKHNMRFVEYESEERKSTEDDHIHFDSYSSKDWITMYRPQCYMRYIDGKQTFIPNVRIMMAPGVNSTIGVHVPMHMHHNWQPEQLYDTMIVAESEPDLGRATYVKQRYTLQDYDRMMQSLFKDFSVPLKKHRKFSYPIKKLKRVYSKDMLTQDQQESWIRENRYDAIESVWKKDKLVSGYATFDPSESKSHGTRKVIKAQGPMYPQPIAKRRKKPVFLTDDKGNVLYNNMMPIRKFKKITILKSAGIPFKGSREVGAPFRRDEEGRIVEWWCYSDNQEDHGMRYTMMGDWATMIRNKFLKDLKNGHVNVCQCVEHDKEGKRRVKFQAFMTYKNQKLRYNVNGQIVHHTTNVTLFCDIKPIGKHRMINRGSMIQKVSCSKFNAPANIRWMVEDNSEVKRNQEIARVYFYDNRYLPLYAATNGVLVRHVNDNEVIVHDQYIGSIEVEDKTQYNDLAAAFLGTFDYLPLSQREEG